MKTNTASISVLGTLVIAALLVIGILEIQHVYAQVDATSSDAAVISPTGTTLLADATTSETADTATTDATATASTDTSTAAASDSVTPTEPPPQGLTEVHIVGTKYIDYFTDGTTVTAYPGNPAIDSNFDKANAPIPTHEGLTWVHTTGGYMYDTPSGDLEIGDYAVQPDGSYIQNARPSSISSTSTPAVLGASTSALDASAETASTSTTTTGLTNTIAPATTSTDSTTTSSNQ